MLARVKLTGTSVTALGSVWLAKRVETFGVIHNSMYK